MSAQSDEAKIHRINQVCGSAPGTVWRAGYYTFYIRIEDGECGGGCLLNVSDGTVHHPSKVCGMLVQSQLSSMMM